MRLTTRTVMRENKIMMPSRSNSDRFQTEDRPASYQRSEIFIYVDRTFTSTT